MSKISKTVAQELAIRGLIKYYADKQNVSENQAFCTIVKTETYKTLLNDDILLNRSDASLYMTLMYELNGDKEAWLNSLLD